jgi:hypothetical protein
VTDDRPREFLQLSDGRYVRVTGTDDGELVPVEEPVKPQRARSGSASTAGPGNRRTPDLLHAMHNRFV